MYEEYFAETNEDHYRKSQLGPLQKITAGSNAEINWYRVSNFNGYIYNTTSQGTR